MAHDVFISYANEDRPVAHALCATLEAHQVRCWMAPRDIPSGAEWAGAISDAISHSSVFVLIFSDFSNHSRQVIREVGLAVGTGGVVIPLRLEDVPLSSTMEYFVSTCHWLDALTPPLQTHLNTLTSRIQALLQQKPSAEAACLSTEPVVSPGEMTQRPGAPNTRGTLAWVPGTATRLRQFCTRMTGRARARLQKPDLGSHEASPLQPATPPPSGDPALETPALDSAAYRAAIRRRLDARKQHRKARLALGAGTLVVVLVLAFTLSSGLKAHRRGPAADTGGSGQAQGGPAADTAAPNPAQGEPAANIPGPGPAQGEPAADTGAPGPAQGEPAAGTAAPSPAQGAPAAGTPGPGPAQGEPAADTAAPSPAQGGPAGNSGGTGVGYDTPTWEPPRIRNRARVDPAVGCAGHLKSLAEVCRAYSVDYDGRLPLADWAPAIYPYGTRYALMRNYKLYECPAAPHAWGYALNSKVLGQRMPLPYQKAPLLLFDSSANVLSAVGDTTTMAYRHRGHANVAFMDGHGGWYDELGTIARER
jgi:prepilin-type processing-associated H-X9-DG protein